MSRVKRILTEKFKPVPGFSNYLVSNYGYILNKKTDRELKGIVTLWGQHQVTLTQNGKQKVCKVHRLVAQAFLLGFDDDYIVEHVSENKNDNSVLNLKMGAKKRSGRAQ